MSDCPCVNCILVPMCRHKPYAQLVECQLLTKYITYYRVPIVSNDSSWRISMFNCLNPTTWTIDISNGRFSESLVVQDRKTGV